MKKITAALGCIALAMGLMNSGVCAQEEKYSYGEVVSVGAEQIVVREYDTTNEQSADVTYKFTADTELYNIDAVSELQVKDSVELYFTDDGSAKTAMAIIKETGDEGMTEADDVADNTTDITTPSEDETAADDEKEIVTPAVEDAPSSSEPAAVTSVPAAAETTATK